METDERYEVNSNGELVIGRPVTLTSKERKELIEKLFSINGWNYTLEKEISQSHFLIKLSNKNLISFIQIIEPIPSPIASGNRNGI